MYNIYIRECACKENTLHEKHSLEQAKEESEVIAAIGRKCGVYGHVLNLIAYGFVLKKGGI